MLIYVRHLFSQRSNALYLGLCLPQAWMFAVSQHLVCPSLDNQLAFHLGMVAGLLTLALMGGSGSRLFSSRLHPFNLASGALMCLLPTTGLVLGTMDVGLETVFAVLSGCGIAWCYALWFGVYCKLVPKDAICYILLGFSLGALLCLVQTFLVQAMGVAVLAVTLLAAVFSAAFLQLLSTSRQSDGAEGDGPFQKELPSTNAQRGLLVAQIILYALIFGNGVIFSILQGAAGENAPDNATSLNYLLRVCMPLVFFVWVAARSSDNQAYLRTVLNVVLLAIAFVLIGVWLVGESSRTVAYAMTSCARSLVLLLVYLTLLKLVWTTPADRRNPMRAFALGRGLYEAAVSLGIVAYTFLSGSTAALSNEQNFVYITALAVFVFLTSCFLATAQTLDTDVPALAQASGTEAQDGPAPDRIDPREAALRQLVNTSALSEREGEILLYFYRGYSKRAIAQTLGLSENTVRWYIQQVYTKMDIHSRDELLGLVDKP